MGPVGWQEMILILVVLLLLFGAKRLPEMGRSLGRGMREFKESITGKDDDEDRPQLASEGEAASPAEEREQARSGAKPAGGTPS